jgi:signal transduction histidine kinase
MPDGGSLTISLSETEELASVGEQARERFAMLSVEDTGVGMDEAVLRRLGEPFFTTRDGGEGTGLGVSMVHAFVRQSGGLLRVDSTPGEGSRFRIMLPVATAPLRDDSQVQLDQVESRPTH